MKKNTWINIGFSLILFLMFVICSFFMLVFGARQYQKGIQVEQVREDTQIPVARFEYKITAYLCGFIFLWNEIGTKFGFLTICGICL